MRKSFHHILLLSAFILVNAVFAWGQTTPKLVKELAIKGKNIQLDETGQLYVVTLQNELIKYSAEGDSITDFKSISNGDIGFLDVSNPLRVLVYYPQYAKCILLDRMLSPQKELNLRQLRLPNSTAMAVSQDGLLWIYDQFSVSLSKLDLTLNPIIQGNDLRQQLEETPHPTYLIKKDRKVYLVDSSQGIFTFDQFGSYINTLQITGATTIQIENNQIIYYKTDTLNVYNTQTFNLSQLTIPPNEGSSALQAIISRNYLCVLYRNHISLFEMPTN